MIRLFSSPLVSKRVFCIFIVVTSFVVIAHVVFLLFAAHECRLSCLLQFPPRYLALVVLLSLLPWIMHSLRLLVWTRFLGTRLTLLEALKIVMGTQLGAAISPTAIGGGAAKIALLVERGVRPGVAALLNAVGGFEDAVFLLSVVPLALVLSSDSDLAPLLALTERAKGHSLALAIALAIAISLVVLVVCLWKRIPRCIRERLPTGLLNQLKNGVKHGSADFLSTLQIVKARGKSRFLMTMPLVAVQWVCRYSMISVLFAAVGLPVKPLQFFVFQWFVYILSGLVPTPGGSLGAEAAFYFVFRPHMTADVAGVLVVAWRFFSFYMLVILGASLMFVLYFRKSSSKPWKSFENTPGFQQTIPSEA
jgi:uncharacterized protein (TIRG00374 family)